MNISTLIHKNTVTELFEEQVKKSPHLIALQYKKTKFTYLELNERVNQIACCLRKKSVQRMDAVALLLEPSSDFIIFVLAIIKIGAIYIPIDTMAPQSRLKELIDDAKPKLIITNDEFLIKLHDIDCTSNLIKQINLESISYSNENASESISPDSPVYMMYTSGSTGKPKGVIVPHCAVVNLVKVDNYANVTAGDIIAQFSNLSFDGSTFEIWSALLNGAALFIVPLSARSNHNELQDILKEHSVSHLFLPTGFFHQLIKSAPNTLDSVKNIIFGGEQANNNVLRNFLHFRKNQQNPVVLINGYGPTEATTFTCKHVMNEQCDLDDERLISIGSAITNVKTYILDENLHEAADGELYISGINLALGYHNSIQNQEKFINNMHHGNTPPYNRLYKTGDRVRKLPTGELLCLGRFDDQVKIGGFRIHLNEVEQQLMKHPDIALAAVTVELGGGLHKMLTAYLVFSSQKSSTHADDIRMFLSHSLPSYMLPLKYVMVENLPLTAVGKVDKKNLHAIPHIDLSCHIDTSSSSSIEETIKNVWQHLLNRRHMEIHKNLFELGANSLLITEACSMLNETLHCELQIADLLAYPTIYKLSRYLEGNVEPTVPTYQKMTHSSDIAIIGMSCRFPEANTIDEFWENLCQGKDCLTRFDKELIKNASVDHKNFVPVKGILKDIELFDASFFGFSPVDARITDPQHRLFLECVWEALEHAGVAPEKNPAKTISVFSGMTDSTYLQEHLLKNHWFCNEHDHFQQRIATSIGMLSTQVSYRLNLKGRSVNVNTACSTGLMTVDQACQDLIIGKSDIALAGTSSVVLPQINGYLYQEGSIVSPDGECRPFADNANGTVFSNGAGVVVLKRLADAIEEGDTIYAVIKSSSVNNDGADKLGFTAPSLSGQMSCIREALAQANLNASDIGLVEAHGTATALGDVIELKALTSVYREQSDKQGYCALGSVKANIGHTDVTAGIAGLIKAALCLHHKKIPPLIHFNAPNPNLMLDQSPFFVNSNLMDWNDASHHRYAAVSAFGVGGTNIHLILSDHKISKSKAAHPAEEALFLFSAKSEPALEKHVHNIGNLMRQKNPSPKQWRNIAYTLQTGREDFQWRQFIVSKSREQFQHELAHKAPKLVDEDIHHSIVLMFSGQGTQYAHMAMSLYDHVPLFKKYIDLGVELAEPYLNCTLLDVIDTPDSDQLNQTEYTQPALFIIEYALSQVIMRCGIKPKALIGHSIGEYVAACIAGVFSFEDGIALVCERGLLMAKAAEGNMLALECTEEELLAFQEIAHFDIALHNATNHRVLAGTVHEMTQLASYLTSTGKPFHQLTVSHAFHSQLMESLEPSFKNIFAHIKLSPPKIPIVSNVTGTWLSASEALDPNYWYQHLRHTVQFHQGINLLLSDQHPLFIEVGLGQSLCSFVKESSKGKANTFFTLPNRHQKTSDLFQLLTCFGELWMNGVTIQSQMLFETEKRQHIPLPTYPFQKQRYWLEPDKDRYSSKIRYFKPVWSNHKVNTATELAQNSIAAHSWIIIKDHYGLAEKFIRFFKNRQITPIVIAFDGTYSCNDFNFSINLKQKDHYVRLINAIKPHITNPVFLNLASFGLTMDETSSDEHLENQLQLGFNNLLYLSQAIIEDVSLEDVFKIATVTNGTRKIIGTESINPLNATLMSASRVMMQENPKVKLKLFDINPEQSEQHIIYTILDSCINREWDESYLLEVYRNTYQWNLTYSEIPAKKINRNRLKDSGVYIVTGGLGGIALSCCEAIAQTVTNSRFILLTRHIFPPASEWEQLSKDACSPYQEKINQLLTIKKLGAHVAVEQVDITDLHSLEKMVQQYIATSGTINGLIHTAGISEPALTQDKTQQSVKNVFAPKIMGTFNLVKCFRDISLDFVVLKSSLSSILGGFEQVDYAAANAFLDAVSMSDLFPNAAFVCCINWNTWNEVGIAARDKKAGKASFIGKGDDISTEEGKKIFIDILEGEDTQVAVSKKNINDISLDYVSNVMPVSTISREHLAVATEYLKPTNETERLLVEIWQNVLGIDTIGTTDNFFSLGGHSLLAFSLIEKINKSFNCSFPMTQIYSTSTIQQLCTAISNKSVKIKTPLITPLKKTPEEKNLFLIHPISGLISCYDPFVKESNLPMSLYGLHDSSTNTNSLPYKDMQSMIEDYFLAIRQIQPEGPYNLIGYSFGGVICNEIANKFIAEKEEVGLLCLIDSWALSPPCLQDEHIFKSHLKGQNSALPDSITNLAWEREKLFISHKINKSNQKMLLFKASRTDDYYTACNSPVNGWEHYNEGHITCHLIESTHETILDCSNCITMLSLIKEYLKNT